MVIVYIGISIGYCECKLIRIDKYKFLRALKCNSHETPASRSQFGTANS